MDATPYKLTDYLENRVLIKNTGTCKSCGKVVYWSREKVNSHKRSRNCSTITEDELNFFKTSFPSSSKKMKTEVRCKSEPAEIALTINESFSLIRQIPEEVIRQIPEEVMAQSEMSLYEKEDKFISVIYPTFQGTSKLKLIEEILELKRKNEILEDKVETYAKAINDLL